MSDNWYAPIEEQAPQKKPRKRRGLRIALWIAVPLLLAATALTLLNTLGSIGFDFSVKAERKNGDAPSIILPDSDDDGLPDSKEDFFAGFYETTVSESTEINIEHVSLPVDFELVLKDISGEELSLNILYTENAETIVGISGYSEDETGYSWGTGIVLSADGLILTNTHVIDGSDSVMVTLFDDSEYEAKLVGADSISDVAVLKIDAEGLKAAEFGDSSKISIGEAVAAIGNPLGEGFRCTLTNGIISAIDRGVSYNGHNMTLLQTNAAINEGNSGGALFNMYGQVIGVTNMKMMSGSHTTIEGIGFAIPSTTLRTVVNSILEHGEYRGRTSVGVTIGAIPETAMAEYELPSGLYVTAVSEGSDAEAKGILVGDIITEVNGIPVSSTDEVAAIKNEFAVGDELQFTIWRDGEILSISVELMDTVDVYG